MEKLRNVSEMGGTIKFPSILKKKTAKQNDFTGFEQENFSQILEKSSLLNPQLISFFLSRDDESPPSTKSCRKARPSPAFHHNSLSSKINNRAIALGDEL